MMYMNNEDNILEFMRECNSTRKATLFNGNSLEKKVQRALFDGTLVSNNAHDALPPDYYSDIHSIMFDMFRIDDTEKNKKYNPQKIRESQAEKEVNQVFGEELLDNVNFFAISETDDMDEHLYSQYTKQFIRVFNNHINKLDIWKSEHPLIKYKGMFICDETEMYFYGKSFPNPYRDIDGNEWARQRDLSKPLHKPWLDKNFMESVYKSPLDFCIWFFPWKPYTKIRLKDEEYPSLIIMDIRNNNRQYIDYDNGLVV